MVLHRYLPGDKKPKICLDELLRVDHAGEYGAVRIYDGQLRAARLRGWSGAEAIERMGQQERVHEEYFSNLLRNLSIRPSCFWPLWHIGGLMLGWGSAMCSEEMAMACTVAIETVIANHYREQIEYLENFIEHPHIFPQPAHVDSDQQGKFFWKLLKQQLERFRREEMEHLDDGLEHGAESVPALFQFMIKMVSRAAIVVAKRF